MSGAFMNGNALIPLTVGRFAKFGPRELLPRALKQGIINADSKFNKQAFVESRLSMSIEVVAAFTGEKLSEDQLVKLEHTALSHALDAERAPIGGGQQHPTEATGNGHQQGEGGRSVGGKQGAGGHQPRVDEVESDFSSSSDDGDDDDNESEDVESRPPQKKIRAEVVDAAIKSCCRSHS